MQKIYVALCYYEGKEGEKYDEMIGLEVHGVKLEGLRKVEILEIDGESDEEKIVHTWKRPTKPAPDAPQAQSGSDEN